MTQFAVEGQALIDVSIEGLEIPTQGGTYVEVRTVEGLGDLVPTALLTITDGTGLMQTKLNVVDGTKVSLSFRRDANHAGTIEEYRVFSRPKSGQNSPGVQNLTFTLVLDVPKWYARVLRTAYEGPSSQVIKNIAQESGIQTDPEDLDLTVDNQVWQCLQKTAASCAMDISAAGYISETSCMKLGIRADKTLFYKDIMQVATSQPVAKFSNAPKDGEFKALQIQLGSSAGLSNNLGNYGTQTLQMEGDGQNTIYSEAQAKLTETDVPINSEVRDAAEGVRRIKFLPQSAGNSNKNYEQAKYQNERLLMMFSESVYLIVDVVTNVKLGSCVELVYYDDVGGALHPASGLYIVERKVRVCRNGNTYGERFDLKRHQVDNEQGPTKLAEETDTQITNPNTTSVSRKARLESDQAGELRSATDLVGLLKGSTGSIIDSITRTLGLDLSQLGSLSAALRTIHPIPTVEGLTTRIRAQHGNSILDPTAIRAMQVLRPSSLSGSLLQDLAGRMNMPMVQISSLGSDIARLSKGILDPSDFMLMGQAVGLPMNFNVLESNFDELTKLANPNVFMSIKALNLNGYGAISALGGSVTESMGVLNSLGSSWDLGSLTRKLGDLNPDFIKNPENVARAWATQTTWFNGWTEANGVPEFLATKGSQFIQSNDELQVMMRTAKIPLNVVPAVLHEASSMVPSQANSLMDRVMSWAVPEEARNLGQTRSILARVVNTFTDWKAT